MCPRDLLAEFCFYLMHTVPARLLFPIIGLQRLQSVRCGYVFLHSRSYLLYIMCGMSSGDLLLHLRLLKLYGLFFWLVGGLCWKSFFIGLHLDYMR